MDSALKQRLLGAAVLIALAIIFVPMFFSSSPPKQDSTTLSLSIPPAPERNFETRNLSVDATAKNGAAPKPAKPVPADPNKVATVNTGAPSTFETPDQAATPATATKPAPATAPAPAPGAGKPGATPGPVPPPAPAADNEGHFVVSLGIYADAGGAAALVAKVKKLGYPAFAEATEYQGKPAQRVRVGPYADRAAAEGVRLKIKQSEDKVPSSVVDLGDRAKDMASAAKGDPGKGESAKSESGKAEASKTDSSKADPNKADAAKSDKNEAPAQSVPTVPANRAGGYAVQVGAFKAEDEANKLRDRLRNGGVAAFIEKAGSGEQTMWKVRAGPYVDRIGADTALANIKQKFQINGMITTQP